MSDLIETCDRCGGLYGGVFAGKPCRCEQPLKVSAVLEAAQRGPIDVANQLKARLQAIHEATASHLMDRYAHAIDLEYWKGEAARLNWKDIDRWFDDLERLRDKDQNRDQVAHRIIATAKNVFEGYPDALEAVQYIEQLWLLHKRGGV